MLRRRKKNHVRENEVDLSFRWRKKKHARSTYRYIVGKIRRPPPPLQSPLLLPSRKGVSHHGRQTLIHLQLTRALAACSRRERQRRISASGSLYRVYHVCACEYRTYKWKKDGSGRPSPAANPLIYRLRVSACIRRLGHMPLPPPPSSSFLCLSSWPTFSFSHHLLSSPLSYSFASSPPNIHPLLPRRFFVNPYFTNSEDGGTR